MTIPQYDDTWDEIEVEQNEERLQPRRELLLSMHQWQKLQDDVAWKLIVGKAMTEIAEAKEALVSVDPTDSVTIARLQGQILSCRQLVGVPAIEIGAIMLQLTKLKEEI